MSALTSQVLTVGINFAAATATPVAAPSNGQQILLRGLCLIVNGATTITFNSQMSGFGFGPFTFSAAGVLVLPDLMPTEEANPFYTGCAANTALVIANSGSIQTSGFLRYSLV